jgi:MFS family permease
MQEDVATIGLHCRPDDVDYLFHLLTREHMEESTATRLEVRRRYGPADVRSPVAVGRLTIRHQVDDDGRDELLRPRDDIVAERAIGDGTFELAEGPLSAYRREVTVIPAPDGRHEVVEHIEFQLGIPYWGPLLNLPARSALKRWRIRDGRQPFWAPPQRLDHRSARVLGVLGATAIFAGYLTTLVGQTITFAVEEFGSSNSAQGLSLGVVRTGALIALGVVALADRKGRRVAVMLSVVAGILATAAGAASPSLAWLTASQVVARSFGTALIILLAVFVVEEMPKGSRAYGASMVGMAGSFGAFFAVAALPLADLGERGWRLVYLVPLLGLPLARGVSHRLPESKRFDTEHTWGSLRGHGRRLAMLAVVFFSINLFVAPAASFRNEYLNDELGWSASLVTLFVITVSTPAGLFVLAGGRLADVWGRRPVGAIGLSAGMVLAAFVFVASGPGLWFLGFGAAALGGAAAPALAVYGPELFPTRIRSSANGLILLIQVTGSAIGLWLAGWMADQWGRLAPGMMILLIGPLAAALIVWTQYPETAQRELEEINPDE